MYWKDVWAYLTPPSYIVVRKDKGKIQAEILFCYIVMYRWHIYVEWLYIRETRHTQLTFLSVLPYLKLWYASTLSVLVLDCKRCFAYVISFSLSKDKTSCTEDGWVSLNVYFQTCLFWLFISWSELAQQRLFKFFYAPMDNRFSKFKKH